MPKPKPKPKPKPETGAPRATNAEAARRLFTYMATPYGPLHIDDAEDLGLAQLVRQGRDHSKFRSLDKLSERRRDNLEEVLDTVAEEIQQPTRPLQELLDSDGPLNVSESSLLSQHFNINAISPKNMTNTLSYVLYEANFSDFMTYWNMRWLVLQQNLARERGVAIRGPEPPYNEVGEEVMKLVVKELEEYRDCPIRATVYEILIMGIIIRLCTGSHTENVDAMRIVTFLVDRGVRANKVNVLGYTALYPAMNCSNMMFVCSIEFAELMLKAGADINQKDRRGYTPLIAACASSVTHGEDDKRAVAVKWLLEHGANPDVCAHAGYSARMNARHSKVMTQLIKKEDARRSKLPLRCRYCLHIPPDRFEPGLESIGSNNVADKEKAPPKRLLMCSVCHKVAYCGKECQKNDWKHHKKFVCKPAVKK